EAPLLYGPNLSCLVKSGIELDGWELREWPHRSKIFRLRVYVGAGGGALDRVAEFSVTNPWRTVSSAWRAQALPTTQRTNDLALTLLKLTTGQTGQESGTRAEFVMKEAGEPTSFWAVTRIAIRSPWGEYPHGALGRNCSN